MHNRITIFKLNLLIGLQEPIYIIHVKNEFPNIIQRDET
jgi:hypothetical protein